VRKRSWVQCTFAGYQRALEITNCARVGICLCSCRAKRTTPLFGTAFSKPMGRCRAVSFHLGLLGVDNRVPATLNRDDVLQLMLDHILAGMNMKVDSHAAAFSRL
jgi:hypothetical protein